MAKRERQLMNCPLFQGLTEEEIVRLLPCLRAKAVSVAPGELLLPVEEEATQVAVLLSGSAKVADGRILKAGDSFGESYSCAGGVYPPSAVAEEECEVLRFDCRRALTTCDHSCKYHRRLMRNLVAGVARESLEREEKLGILSQRTTRDKLLAYLRNQSQQQGSAEFVIPLDRQGLADYLGVERSAMSTELGKLRRDGILECKKSWFKLL